MHLFLMSCVFFFNPIFCFAGLHPCLYFIAIRLPGFVFLEFCFPSALLFRLAEESV
ncbi:hypothetical protein BC829DRAFT_398758, partial [Chytridium lagenaria]